MWKIYIDVVLHTQFRVEMMDSFVKLAKYRYECGNYSVSTSYLYFYMLIMPPTDKVISIFIIIKIEYIS